MQDDGESFSHIAPGYKGGDEPLTPLVKCTWENEGPLPSTSLLRGGLAWLFKLISF